MTDFSQFDTSTSQFDATALDESIQTISAVERTWRSPALPDEVKYDLATLPEFGDATQLRGFLTGLDADFHGDAEDDDPVAPELPPLQFDRLDTTWGRSTFDEIRVLFADLAGEPAPTDPTVDAVKLFKKRAVERGYLERPANGVVDASWSPELNSVRWEMAFDDYDRRQAGDRSGATTLDTVITTIGEWTSPTGLLAAATELDLFWDFGAIDREISSWGDKWRKVGESDGPFDFAKNLVDAVTGPIDDIVMPALNWLLLGSGVGMLTNTARFAWMGARAQRGLKLFDTLYSARGATAALAQPSLTAARLAKSSRASVRTIGEAMSAWRQFEGVTRVKAGVQAGMRLGVASQLQDALPGYQGGRSIADVPGMASVNQTLQNLALDPRFLPVELALAPQNIFHPGAFLRSGGEGANLLSRAGSGALNLAGSTTGRTAAGAVVGGAAGAFVGDDGGDVLTGAAAGALGAGAAPKLGAAMNRFPRVATTAASAGAGAALGATSVALLDDDASSLDIMQGAAAGATLLGARSVWNNARNKANTGKFVGYMSDLFEVSSFRPLAEDQRVAASFHRALEATLEPEDLQRYRDAFTRKGSFLGAYADLLRVDEERAAASVGYLMTSAAIDHTATVQASAAGRNGLFGRYHMHRNKLVSQLRTFDMTEDGSVLLHEAATSQAWRKSETRASFKRAYEEALSTFRADPDRALEWVAEHNRQARQLQRQLLTVENLPDLDPDIAGMLRRGSSAAENGGILEAYLIQKAPFMRWEEFSANTLEISHLQSAGLFDAAQLKASRGWATGAARRADKTLQPATAEMQAVDDVIADAAFRDPNVDWEKLKGSKTVSPLAFSDPHGRITVARKSTKSKHELRDLADEIRDLLELSDNLAVTKNLGADMATLAKTAAADFETLTDAQIEAALSALKATRATRPAKNLRTFAKRLGLTADELQVRVSSRLDELASDPDLWEAYGLRRFARDGDELLTGEAALRARLRQLDEAGQYTAAEVDAEALLRYWDEVDSSKADELRALLDGLDRDDYKLVYGVEFMMPHDLVLSPTFRDISTKNMHAVTLGNFFRGRLPAEARALEERRQRVALAEAFRARGGLDVAPESQTAGDALADLRTILDSEQHRSAELLDNMPEQTFAQRKVTALRTNATPLRLEDLANRKSLVVDNLRSLGWTEEQAEAIYTAIPKFRNTEFRDLGLYSFEAKLRTRNELVSGLKVLSGSKYGDSFMARSRGTRKLGAVTGMAYGGFANDDDSFFDAQGALVGAAIGAGAGTVAQAGLRRAEKLIPAAELRQVGMLGDKFVRTRDSLRFTLSPFFDISRYTEGQMLAQTAAPLRNANGERIVMKLDMSPRSIRRQIRKQHMKAGDDYDTATRKAFDKFDQYRNQFRAAAKGDFDPDVLDSAGRWFAQVGIMGFNPTDWMVSAFSHLTHNGISADEAYRAVREMYTYGTTGRSAAEMSVNFIFFPFSFQKKALGHVAKWMSDDLGRSLIVHDSFKAYEMLDERYNLDEFWRDHVPALEQLERLNMFAFGVSPGRMGGINAPFVEAGVKAATGLFTPTGLSIKDAGEAAEVQDVVRSLTPAINDINWMIQDMKEQGHVVFSDSHLTTRAEVRQGFDEWNEYKRQVGEHLSRQGFTFSDMHSKPYLSDLKMAYEVKRAEIGERYPAWREKRSESVYNAVALDMEKKDRLARAAQDPDNATAGDVMLAEMEAILEEIKTRLYYRGYDVGGRDGWTDAPPEVFQFVTAQGVARRQQDERFLPVWDKFYSSDFGPLEAQI